MLQMMLNKLYIYCNTWGLKVNLTKTKIMICKRGGGRNATNEKWKFGSENLEVVNEYKYLGITVTPQMKLNKHLQDKLKVSIFAINCTWKSIMRNQNIAHSVKYQVFNSVMRSVMCYGAEFWGYSQCDEVEKLQRFFIKKLFHLPKTTPNYMILLETRLAPLYIFTLKMHIDYISKVLNYDQHRLPHKIAREIIRKNIGWACVLKKLIFIQ